MSQASVQIQDLAQERRGELVLHVESLDLGPGRVHLAGPNGAGKTTLLEVLATLAAPTQGTITLAGHRLPDQARKARARLGYAGHEASLHEAFTAHQALEVHARLHEVPRRRVDEALATWGLATHARRAVSSLSHGQRRRLDLARALIHEPSVVLLDEPATGLDEAGLEILSTSLDELGPDLAVVASPEDPPVETDRRVQLDDGRIVEDEP